MLSVCNKRSAEPKQEIKMHRFIVALVATAACVSSAAQGVSAASELPALTLQLTVLNAETHHGKEETAAVTLTNTSRHVIYVAFAPFSPFKLEVRNQHGIAVRETALGMKAHGTGPHREPLAGSYFAAPLKAGTVITVPLPLGQEFDLSGPGVYRVIASRYDGYGNWVRSNEVQFRVLAN